MYFVRYTGHIPGVGGYSVVSYFGHVIAQGTFNECRAVVAGRTL